jgi:ADP-dependent NAD(P)H-hydrate dehydratase / NAD(P)H-hydrate epimerase
MAATLLSSPDCCANGLARAPAAHYADWIATANELVKRDNCPLLALDCPSGLNADSGTVPGECISASHTITFISGKPGLLTADGPDHCGEIHLATLGLAADSDEANHTAIAPDGLVISTGLFASRLQPRQKNSHKGSFGGVGVIGGSHSMAGAALLAGRAALKLGAGRVYLGLLDPDGPAVDLSQAELMIRPVDTLFQADLQALLCGPGLGQSAEAIQWLEQALDCPLPLVLDADALNLLALDRRLEAKLSKRTAPAILTPHPAEAARLLETSTHEVQADRITAACALARRYACPVALKGCGTVIAAVDGRWWINTTGNPGMATAGMGDVLSGTSSTLLAQNWPAELALDRRRSPAWRRRRPLGRTRHRPSRHDCRRSDRRRTQPVQSVAACFLCMTPCIPDATIPSPNHLPNPAMSIDFNTPLAPEIARNV